LLEYVLHARITFILLYKTGSENLIKNFSVVGQGIMHGAYDNKEVIKTYLPQQERGK
jgi:hypothetical protein